MKYYHVIYNSSQKGLNGSNGFGIRTATEGTPREYLDAVVKGVADNKFANAVTNCNVPLPQELMETEGKAILRVPPRYFFQTLDVIGGRKLYTLGRNIYVGFTETFYYKDKEGNILGKSGRMGTYLIDMYLFEECPPKEVFDILYEQPAKDEYGKDCNSFVPKDPSPFKENFEMANLTTGDPVMLKAEDRKFTSVVNAFSPKVIDLLLAIMDAKLSDRQLFVKYPWQQTHQLIANAFRFLPDRNLSELTFSTNYTGNGFNAPADLLFINEYYKAQFAGKGLLVDLEATTYQGDEAKAFRLPIEEAMRANDFGKIRKIMAWVLSPDYKTLGNASADTKAVMFIYSQMPEDFKIKMVDEAKNRDELVSALYNHFKSSGNNSKFIEVLTEKIDLCNNLEQIIEAVKDLEYYTSKGIDVSSVKTDQQEHINDTIMSLTESGNASVAISKLGLDVVRKYTDDLRSGWGRNDLSEALFAIWKEKAPVKLTDIKQNLATVKVQNDGLYRLILQNFSAVFAHVYQALLGQVNSRNKDQARNAIQENIILPLQDEIILASDATFQDFNLFYQVLSDNDTVINASNFTKVIGIIRQSGLADSKIGKKAKELILNNSGSRNVAQAIQQLKDVWQMSSNDIIRDCQESPMKKEFIKGILEDSVLRIEDVILLLKNNDFTDNERELFLSSSSRYKSAYSSYRRKKLFSGIFGKILGIFKRKSKDSKEPQQAGSSILHSKSRPRPSVQQQNAKPELISPSQTAYAPKPKLVERPAREFTEAELDQVEIYLQNRGLEVSDTVKENAEEVERRFYESRRKNGIPPELRRFVTYFRGLLLLFGLSFLTPCESLAAGQIDSHIAYGDIKDAPKCYIVSPQTLNVRTSPSLYKGKRKKTKRKDNVGFKLNQGDTIFVSALVQPSTADGVTWISFTHEGTDYYTDITKLTEIDNPRLVRKVSDEKENNADGFLGWLQRSAPTILLVLTGILFLLWILGILASADSWKDYFRAEVRDDTKMRPMFMYSLQPYKSAASVSLALLICFAASIIIMLAIGGVVWGFLWIVKLLVWGLIIIGWICLIVGVICIFVNWAVAIPCLIIGGLIYHYQESLESFGNACVATGMAFFDAINVWEFSRDLVQHYWQHALVISLAPMVLFLIGAALAYLYALCLRGYEAWTTHRYNVKHPCPWCHEPSEPAEYYDEDAEHGRVVLPAALRPGIYGLFHIVHPVTGNEMPTLISNGRDQLLRKCPHCHQFVNFEAGTEKHIGFIGMPESGKTSLLCNIMGLMMKAKHDMHFTNTTDENILELQDNVEFAKSNGHLDENHLPVKTGANWRASIQCILPRANGGLPYHLYFNDVAGELFTSGGNDKNLLRFSQDVENIVFIIDPMTMKFNEQKISDRFMKWLHTEEVEQGRQSAIEEVLTAFDSMVNALDGSKRDFGKINLTFALVKSDMGYLNGVNKADENDLRDFMKDDMAIGNVIHAAESKFNSVSYISVSVFLKDDKGVQRLCDKLIQQLELS